MFIGPQVATVCFPPGVTHETGHASRATASLGLSWFLWLSWFSAQQQVRTPLVSLKEQQCPSHTPSLISSLKGHLPLQEDPCSILMSSQGGERLFWPPAFYRRGPVALRRTVSWWRSHNQQPRARRNPGVQTPIPSSLTAKLSEPRKSHRKPMLGWMVNGEEARFPFLDS